MVYVGGRNRGRVYSTSIRKKSPGMKWYILNDQDKIGKSVIPLYNEVDLFCPHKFMSVSLKNQKRGTGLKCHSS